MTWVRRLGALEAVEVQEVEREIGKLLGPPVGNGLAQRVKVRDPRASSMRSMSPRRVTTFYAPWDRSGSLLVRGFGTCLMSDAPGQQRMALCRSGSGWSLTSSSSVGIRARSATV